MVAIAAVRYGSGIPGGVRAGLQLSREFRRLGLFVLMAQILASTDVLGSQRPQLKVQSIAVFLKPIIDS
jgi:hypothetical protein